MFEKDKCFPLKKSLIVPKFGATDGSYTVVGSANDFYTVTPGVTRN